MKVVAITGTYRKGKVTDQMVKLVLKTAEEAGADIEQIYLIDENIHFCDNCRSCCQEEGVERGTCVWDHKENQTDSMAKILDAIQKADALVIASPINASHVTAVTKRFVERLLPLYYWPWKNMAPRSRDKTRNKKAIVVTASAMPACLGRIFTSVVRFLRDLAKALGAKQIKTFYIGGVARSRDYQLPDKTVVRARQLGKWLAQK